VMIASVRDDPAVASLVTRANSGEQAAWDEIVARYAPLVWAIGKRYRLSGADIDDMGAFVWLRLGERLATIRDPAALPGWLATTARRECLRLLEARLRQVPVDDDRIADPAPGAADEWLLTQERQIALRVAFAELPEHCRRLLSMLFRDPPAPYAEINASTGIAIGSIGPTRQRCLDRLRRSPGLAALRDAPSASTESR
jgi:RNA polymerase sigma factor (sigma-70 family)